jgi:hypothetical protein
MLLTNAFQKSLAAATLAFALSAPALHTQVIRGSMVQFVMIGIIAYPPNPLCVAQQGFRSSSGDPVGPAKTVNLAPGLGDFLHLKGASLSLPFSGREELRPSKR